MTRETVDWTRRETGTSPGWGLDWDIFNFLPLRDEHQPVSALDSPLHDARDQMLAVTTKPTSKGSVAMMAPVSTTE